MGLGDARGSLDRIETRIAAGDSEGVLIEMVLVTPLRERPGSAVQACPVSQHDQLCTVAGVKFGEQVADVGFHRRV